MTQKLEIMIWDVQHGNAIYMKTPNGTHFCFDIGNGSFASGETFSPLAYLKETWKVERLDYLVISHPHADHISDIKALFEKEMKPRMLLRPKNLSEEFIRQANQNQFADTIDLYFKLDREYIYDVAWENNPLNPENNGGVYIENFYQREEGLNNLNNYSYVSVIEFGDQKIIIPGDLEISGWKALMKNNKFIKAIEGTKILLASHHGRENGFHSEIFKYFIPDIVIISDGRFCDTSATDRYRYYANGSDVLKKSSGETIKRWVLTTRKDCWIYIRIELYPNSKNTKRRIVIK